MVDIKGDPSGIAKPGAASAKLEALAVDEVGQEVQDLGRNGLDVFCDGNRSGMTPRGREWNGSGGSYRWSGARRAW
jgi:hypothetical protein